jgi:hypothetical protein
MNKYQFFGFLFVICTFGMGCKVSYSTSGGSLHPDLKTVSIQYFQNQAATVHPTLSQDFTEALKKRLISQTRLKLVNGVGDLNFEGEIKEYETRPQEIQGDERAASNRLTITVRVKYTNSIEQKFDFDNSFSRYADYPSEKNLDQVSNELNKKIIEQLTDDIFNKALVNW